MDFFKRLFQAGPQHWSDIPSTNIVIECYEVDKELIESTVQEALKLRKEFSVLCKKLQWDDVYQNLSRRRTNGELLSEKEDRYLNQAEVNYLEMVCDKMELTILYELDWNSLSVEDRNIIYRISEKIPGCSIISSLSGLRYGKLIRFPIGTILTNDQVEKMLANIL